MALVSSLVNYGFAFNGFAFGGGSSPYQIMSIDGLKSLPALRVQDDNRGYSDGSFSGRDFLSGRTISIIMEIYATPGGATAQANFATLQSNLQPQQGGTGVLQFQIPGSSLQRINARVRVARASIDSDFTLGRVKAQYDFFCPDPRYYDDALVTTILSFTGTTLGRTYPRVYNLTYPLAFVPNVGAVTNNGWATSYPLITIIGPCTNPAITNTVTGQVLQILGVFGGGDTIVLDTNLRTVTLNSNPARNLLSNASSWFAAPVGSSYFSFTGASIGVGSTATVAWRNAYV